MKKGKNNSSILDDLEIVNASCRLFPYVLKGYLAEFRKGCLEIIEKEINKNGFNSKYS